MIKTKRVSFQRVLLSTSKSRDLNSAANEWKFRDYSESSYESIPCSFCGQPTQGKSSPAGGSVEVIFS